MRRSSLRLPVKQQLFTLQERNRRFGLLIPRVILPHDPACNTQDKQNNGADDQQAITVP